MFWTLRIAIKPISIHTLHTEGDGRVSASIIQLFIFQSTPSTRRVTSHLLMQGSTGAISIHTLHTEGDDLEGATFELNLISIHTLHTEGDSKYKQLYHICTSIDYTIYPII